MEKQCAVCQKTYYVKPSEFSASVYCSRSCMATQYKSRFRGKGNPGWKGGALTKLCPQCGSAFFVIKSEANKRKFCSVFCHMAGRTKSAEADRESFWTRVNKTHSCWLWTGATRSGYGQFYTNRKLIGAHRWAYQESVGPIAKGLHIDHLCRTPLCVNPAHLEPVTNRENLFRGPTTFTAINSKKTHCAKGHPFDEQNTYIRKNGSRHCRTCNRDRTRVRRS
jgi:hypothetical protein